MHRNDFFAQVTADFCIDLKKLFTIGISNGGTFANLLASVRMKEIRAVVAVGVPPMGGNWRKVVMPSMLVQDDRDNFGSAQQTVRKRAQDAGNHRPTLSLTAVPRSVVGSNEPAWLLVNNIRVRYAERQVVHVRAMRDEADYF